MLVAAKAEKFIRNRVIINKGSFIKSKSDLIYKNNKPYSKKRLNIQFSFRKTKELYNSFRSALKNLKKCKKGINQLTKVLFLHPKIEPINYYVKSA